MKRFIHLWLPFFATDRLTRPGAAFAEWRERPLAVMARDKGALRVAAANAAARRAGVAPGLAAADASALCPGLKTVPAHPAEEVAALTRLAEWCRRWSPWTAPEGEDGIWIDASGCAHLFGGERAMLDDIAARLGGFGLALRAGLADTPGAAWALSHCGDEPLSICPEGAVRQWLASFPIAALRLEPQAEQGLRRLGLRRIGDLLALPRAPLASRFGREAALRLDQVLGRAPEPLSPIPFVEPIAARLAWPEPIGRTEDVAAAIRHLLEQVCPRLEADGLGARRLELVLFRVDGTAVSQQVGTNEPVRDPGHLMRLFAEGLDGLDAGFGIEVMRLAVTAADPFTAAQGDIEARPDGASVALLVDRLSRRLGPDRVTRPVPRPTHIPERACGRMAPLAKTTAAWPSRRRPVRLLPDPRPVAVEDSAGRPTRLGGTVLCRAEGPERIAAEWWHGAQPPSPSALRDYWRVEDEDGRRLWLFRTGDSRWFLHGTFG